MATSVEKATHYNQQILKRMNTNRIPISVKSKVQDILFAKHINSPPQPKKLQIADEKTPKMQ